MTFDEYQKAARRTIGNDIRGQMLPMLGNAGLGMAGEAGEFVDHVKKLMYHGQKLTPERYVKMIKESGDILWYLSLGADALSLSGYGIITLEQIGQGNIDKLLARHPGEGVDFSYHDRQQHDG